MISVFALSKLALPHLRRSRGSIVNVASLVATIGQHHATTYVATKGAVLAFTKALAIDEAPHGVRVNAISPGNVYTPLWQQAIDAAPDPGACRTSGETAQVMGRMGTPEEVGPPVPLPGRARHLHDRRRPHHLGRRRDRLRPEVTRPSSGASVRRLASRPAATS